MDKKNVVRKMILFIKKNIDSRNKAQTVSETRENIDAD